MLRRADAFSLGIRSDIGYTEKNKRKETHLTVTNFPLSSLPKAH